MADSEDTPLLTDTSLDALQEDHDTSYDDFEKARKEIWIIVPGLALGYALLMHKLCIS
jgi:hypothetical protein